MCFLKVFGILEQKLALFELFCDTLNQKQTSRGSLRYSCCEKLQQTPREIFTTEYDFCEVAGL